jgi:hypothetical protein
MRAEPVTVTVINVLTSCFLLDEPTPFPRSGADEQHLSRILGHRTTD